MKVLFGFCVAGLLLGLYAIGSTFTHGLIVTNATERVAWGLWEPAYIFLTGMSAGSFVISSLGLFGFKQYKSIARIAVLQALVLLLIAPLFLLVSMGRPERFLNVYLSPNPTSVISWGAYLLALYPLVCLIYGYYLMRRDFLLGKPLSAEVIERHDKRARFWGLLGVPTAVMVHGYTGVLLGFVPGRALWHTPMMPVLFLTSAIVSGIALLIIILSVMNRFTRIKTEPSLIRSMATLMLAVLILDVFFMVAEILYGTYIRHSEHWEAWNVLFKGFGGLMFLGVETFLGIVLPLVLLFRWRDRLPAVLWACVLIIVGIFAMRCNIILGGQVIQAYGGPPGDYMPSGQEWLVMIGLFSLGGILYMAGARFLPLVPRATGSRVEGATS